MELETDCLAAFLHAVTMGTIGSSLKVSSTMSWYMCSTRKYVIGILRVLGVDV